MQTITVHASKKYDVAIGNGLLSTIQPMAERIQNKTVMVVSDDTVFSLYGNRLCSLLSETGCRTCHFVFPHGEQSKNLTTYEKLIETMCAVPMTRSDWVLALGGGVVGDLAGFSAATYQRGIGLIQLPTTLLAAVDSSVGGKNGINLEGGKNQLGTFYQPSQVLCDTDTLQTLPEAEYQNGCAEIIKYAMIGSNTLFQQLQAKPISEQYENVISTCIAMKRDFVEQDEYDLGTRMLLNFGHTIGHAVETCSQYTIAHGKAVAIGMAVMTKAAVAFGYCSQRTYDTLLLLLMQYGLPTYTPFSTEQLAAVITADKKIQGNQITLVIPTRIGNCIPVKIPKCTIPKWLYAGGIR